MHARETLNQAIFLVIIVGVVEHKSHMTAKLDATDIGFAVQGHWFGTPPLYRDSTEVLAVSFDLSA